MQIRYTLLSEGTSDSTLLPVLDWLLAQHVAEEHVPVGQWVDKPRIRGWPSLSFAERLELSVRLYPCQILFVHRDADREAIEVRITEIERWVLEANLKGDVSHIAVVPVRMTEAWLLVDEGAIRRAASNRNGTVELPLPPVHKLEDVPDPKALLFESLQIASGLPSRRLKKFNVFGARKRVAEFIEDFQTLRRLRAFSSLESWVAKVCLDRGWNAPRP